MVCAAAVTLMACGVGDLSPSDAGLRPDLGPIGQQFDGGVAPDAQAQSDAGTDFLGRRIAEVPVDLLFVSPDERELLFTDGRGRLTTIHPDGKDREVIADDATKIFAPRPVVWMFTGASDDGQSATVKAYQPGARSLATVSSSAAHGLLWSDDDGARAIITDRFTIAEVGITSTRTADIVLADSEGLGQTTILSGVNVGLWDPAQARFEGACAPYAAFTSTRTVMVAACSPGTRQRRLHVHDIDRGHTATVAPSVLNIIVPSEDRTWVLWVDDQINVFGSTPDGSHVVALAETATITDLEFLDDTRFAYTTSQGELKIAEWPFMQPSTLRMSGVQKIRSVSPFGRRLLFSQGTQTISDLFMIDTSTDSSQGPVILSDQPTALPGDSAWTPDGTHVIWYATLDDDDFGVVKSRRADGSGGEVLVGSKVFQVRPLPGPGHRLLIMMNARLAAMGRSTVPFADLSVRDLDTVSGVDTLVRGAHAADLVVFPRSSRVVFQVPLGPNAGVWVRDID